MGVAVLGAALVAAAPARGEPARANGSEPLPPNAARLVLGVGFGSSGWACAEAVDAHAYGACNAWSFGSYIPFVLGFGVDLHLAGPSHLGLGANALVGSAVFANLGFANATRTLTVGELTADYVHKFGAPDQGTRGRVRAGLAGYVGGGPRLGGALRIGGGATFWNDRPFGIGLELMVEGGVYAGYWVSTLQLVVSPEVRF